MEQGVYGGCLLCPFYPLLIQFIFKYTLRREEGPCCTRTSVDFGSQYYHLTVFSDSEFVWKTSSQSYTQSK